MSRTALVGLATALVMAGAAGCGGSAGPPRKAVTPVRGAVFHHGKPAAGAVISFHPSAESNPTALRSNGRVGEDGSFALTTYVTADGAPQGDYIVTVYWADPTRQPQSEGDETDLAPDLLQGRFGTREASVLRAKVGNQPIEFAAIDLGSSEITGSREYHLREK